MDRRDDRNGLPQKGSPPAVLSPKRRHLPSLGSFATFEVAAKHLSFTLAASELHVSQAAVSQHIRGLEKALDCQLFVRKRNGMELAAEGQDVTPGWRHLVHKAVAQGRLVRILNRPLDAGRSYYLRIKTGSRDTPHVQSFVAYLLEEIGRLPALHD